MLESSPRVVRRKMVSERLVVGSQIAHRGGASHIHKLAERRNGMEMDFELSPGFVVASRSTWNVGGNRSLVEPHEEIENSRYHKLTRCSNVDSAVRCPGPLFQWQRERKVRGLVRRVQMAVWSSCFLPRRLLLCRLHLRCRR